MMHKALEHTETSKKAGDIVLTKAHHAKFPLSSHTPWENR